ncbi:hypothetical protein [Luteimonas sp. A649]
MQIHFHHSARRSPGRVQLPAVSMLALALMLAGCGGDAANAAGNPSAGGQQGLSRASAKFDPSLRDTPCSVVTIDTVATVFGLPVDEIEQHAAAGMCLYSWKGNGQVMDATIHVTRVSDNAADAADYFASATRGIGGAELDAAMDSIGEKARENAADSAATDALLGAAGSASRSGSGGIQFSEVMGIGDRARMQVGRGDLSVLQDNLHFSVTAYHGDRMPAPAGLAEMVAASREWHKTTLTQREQQTLALARVAVAEL